MERKKLPPIEIQISQLMLDYATKGCGEVSEELKRGVLQSAKSAIDEEKRLNNYARLLRMCVLRTQKGIYNEEADLLERNTLPDMLHLPTDEHQTEKIVEELIEDLKNGL